jgi:hypothetical protein
MSTTLLNEHDANQGAQSKGEFLGMTGNSGWYLLGSAGTTVMMVIVLWGVFGISLLLCMLLGVVLCLLSVVYVFTLKNNKPDHYDTDFFESALVEAGLIELSFGPRSRHLANPFGGSQIVEEPLSTKRVTAKRESSRGQRAIGRISATGLTNPPVEPLVSTDKESRKAKDEKEPVIALSKYEKLQSEFVEVEDRLEQALLEQEESGS